MGKRFAIVIGVAAAGVMALGAQTATAGGEPDLQLSGKKKQKLDNAVEVKASCGDEACTVNAGGWLTNVTYPGRTIHGRGQVHAEFNQVEADLAPGETTTLKLKLSKKERKKAGKVLDEGKKVQARVKAGVDAPDGWDAKRRIKLVK